MDNAKVFNWSHTTLNTFKLKIWSFIACLVQTSCWQLVQKWIYWKSKRNTICMGYGAMLSMENLENQAFTSKNHNLGHKWDKNVKFALISITLAAKKFPSACHVAIVRSQFWLEITTVRIYISLSPGPTNSSRNHIWYQIIVLEVLHMLKINWFRKESKYSTAISSWTRMVVGQTWFVICWLYTLVIFSHTPCKITRG